jgi:hypothetical protein
MKILLSLIMIAFIAFILFKLFRYKKNKNMLKQHQYKEHSKSYVTKKSKSMLDFNFKDLSLAENARKKMFKQTNLNQGYNKRDALHLDKSNDQLQQTIASNDVLKYSQVMHNNQSAFTPQHILQGNQLADTKKILDKATTTHIPAEQNLHKPNSNDNELHKNNLQQIKPTNNGRMKV